MTLGFAQLDIKLEAIKDWANWATKCVVVWRDQDDGGRVREANQVWGELRLNRILTIGQDGEIYEGRDDAEYPRQTVTVAQRNLQIELRMKSRSQEHRRSAWTVLTKAQVRLSNEFARNRYFSPNSMALRDKGDVINMPNERIWEHRIEDVAVMEFLIGTVLCDAETAAIGTWIEHAEITSNLKNAGLEPLDASLQLNKEVMP